MSLKKWNLNQSRKEANRSREENFHPCMYLDLHENINFSNS